MPNRTHNFLHDWVTLPDSRTFGIELQIIVSSSNRWQWNSCDYTYKADIVIKVCEHSNRKNNIGLWFKDIEDWCFLGFDAV
jgi:hypothetical protein